MLRAAVITSALALVLGGACDASAGQKRGGQTNCPPDSPQCEIPGFGAPSGGATRALEKTTPSQGSPAPQRQPERYDQRAAGGSVDQSIASPSVIRLPLRITADAAGHFWTDADIDGAHISRVLIDTGATFVVLCSRDAAAAGLAPEPSEFKHTISTANGMARVARAKLGSVRVADITIRDVDALVAQEGALGNSLLGMSFLSKLSRFTVEAGTLTLRR